MQVAINLPTKAIISMVDKMDKKEFVQLKKAVQKREKREFEVIKFKKEPIDKIVADCKKEGYSRGFLEDLEDGLKNSGLYK